ncbi:hypothetical protein CAPTEDRAFT_173961, partial [Capitella teleta]
MNMAARRKPKHPYNLPVKEGIWSRILVPRTFSFVVACFAAISYSWLAREGSLLQHYGSLASHAALQQLYIRSVLPYLPRWPRLYFSAVAFLVTLGMAKLVGCLRWVALRRLMTWQGWVYGMKSFKTKAWALAVRVLNGPSPYSTYYFQRILPKQPLPSLEKTLERWLAVSENLISSDEYQMTLQAVEEFRRNEGKLLQAYLAKRAKTSPSWIFEYWITAAYLASREPLALKSNYFTSSVVAPERTTDQLSRASNAIWGYARLNEHVQRREFQPNRLQELIPMCMHLFRYLFGSVRIPQDNIDTIEEYPNSRHVIVFRKGQYFRLDLYTEEENGCDTLLTRQEIHQQLTKICEMADDWIKEMGGRPMPVAALTTQHRSLWAKQRRVLMVHNKDSLEAVERALFHVSLDDESPTDVSDFVKRLMSGDGSDRWFDKCFSSITYPNAWNGSNTEHTGLDATVFAVASEFMLTHEKYENGKLPLEGVPRVMAAPMRLDWNLSGLEDFIKVAAERHREATENLDTFVKTLPYGKGQMKRARLSPDGYIQMALHLGFYRMHGYIPKTYEPATNRLFLMGRTETVHPSSHYMLAWIKAMDDPMFNIETRARMLKDAVQQQTKSRLEATIGSGCDRHLLALLCASREMGMDLPKIFMDKAWNMPFVLSTSQCPTMVYEQHVASDMNWSHFGGGFGPSCEHGYGLCYSILGDDILNLTLTSWKTNKETDSRRLAEFIESSMKDMMALFELKIKVKI